MNEVWARGGAGGEELAHEVLGIIEEGSAKFAPLYDEKLNDGLTLTGNRIAEHIKNEKFDPLGNDYQTNVCAYLCGHKAAVIAASPPQPKTKIDKAMYQAARNQVETEMKLLGGGGSGFGC